MKKLSQRPGAEFLGADIAERALTWWRNRLLRRRFGVRRIQVRTGCYLRGLECMRVGEGFDAGHDLWLEAVTHYKGQTFTPRIEIGEEVSISYWGHIAAAHRVTIGTGVMMGSKVTIIDHDHGLYGGAGQSSPEMPPAQRPLVTAGILVGANSWLGDGVVVTAGAEIGEGCVIGANAVVRGAIPAFSIAVGIPARVVKRFDFARKEWIRVDRP